VNCNGIHCPGCGHGSGRWAGVVVVVVGLAVIVAKAHTIEHGIAEVVRVLVVAAITALCVALAAGAIVAAVWYHRRTARAPETRAELPVVIRTLGPAKPAAIEPASPVTQAAVHCLTCGRRIGYPHFEDHASDCRAGLWLARRPSEGYR
jgi:hypothetical protein